MGIEMKRYKFVACRVFQREAYFCAARSPNIVDIVFMHQGLHETPDILRQEVQKELDITTDDNGNTYDAILLGYGLCSNGIVDLTCKIPMVVPRGHDCITLLLGSKEKYLQYFNSHRGVYWYSPGWIDTNAQPGKERFEKILAEYREKYGDDNAEYLMEMEQGWMKEYSTAAYVDWGLGDSESYRQYTKDCAEYLKWDYDQLEGDPSLMQRFLDGKWDDEGEFLIVKPGCKIVANLTSDRIIDSS
jgi:hypothetical protein